jgi:hypothetical protein
VTDQPTDAPIPEPTDAPSNPTDDPIQIAQADEPVDVPADVDKPKKKGKKKKGKKVVVQQVTPPWVRWAAIGTALVVIALAVAAFTQRQHADDVTAEAHDRTAAERVAGEFSETLFTFDAAHPTANLDRLKVLATKAYQPKVDDARQSALAGGSSAAQQASMRSHVTDVYLTELDGDQAHAVTRSEWQLVASDQTLVLDLYLRIDLKREGGSWKVDTVSAITAKQPPGATPTTAPGASTSTTAGPSTTTVAP